MTDREMSDKTIRDFLDGVERQARGEGRIEYTFLFLVEGREILPESGASVDVLPNAVDTVPVKMLGGRALYDEI